MPKTKLNYTDQLLLKIKENNYQPKKIANKKGKNKYYSAIYNLQKSGLIIKGKNNKLKLSAKGVIKTQRLKWHLQNLKGRHKEKNCVVIFDIPENIRRMRSLFRKCLYELGFESVQKSVFLGSQKSLPHVRRLVANCKLQKYVIIIVGKKSKW